MKVGILDGESVQALIFSKQLNKAGYQVILFCDAKLSYGYYTRYAQKRIICPSTKSEIKKFHAFFLKYLETDYLDVVIPMNDYSAKYLSEYKDELKEKVHFSIPNLDVFMTGYDKNKLMNVCEANNLPHPRSVDISKLVAGSNIEFKFPALIKPNETTGARGFRKVAGFDELWKHYGAIYKEYGNCHLQEFIPHGGMQYKVQLLMKKKEVINSSVIAKYRYYPIHGGSSCFNHTIVKDELVKICTEALQIIGWEGFADFDLIEDPRDGSIKIMEINPRSPACIKASVISGIDFPNAIVDLSLNMPVKKYIYRPDKYLRYFSMDLLWLISQKNKWEGFKEWKKHLFSKKHFLQDGDLLDPMPFVVGACASILKQLNPKFRASKKGMNQ